MGRLITVAGGTTRIINAPAIEAATTLRFGYKFDVVALRYAWSYGYLPYFGNKSFTCRAHVDGDNLYLWANINGVTVGGSTPISLASLPANGTDVVMCVQYTTGTLEISLGAPGGSALASQSTSGGTALPDITGGPPATFQLASADVSLNIDAAWAATTLVSGDARFALPAPASNVHLCWCVDTSNVGTSGNAFTLGDGTLTGTGGDWNGSAPPPSVNILRRRRMASGASLI